jgi:hypothetical protein
MKVLAVQFLDGECRIKVLVFNKEQVVSGLHVEEVAKKAMKLGHYFTRDHEIIEDIKQVMDEQNSGIREKPVAPLSV